MLFRIGDVATSYDANAGLRRSMVMSGWINDSRFPDDRFHRKTVRVVISAPRDLELEDKIKQATKIDSPCGFVCIDANVEAERFEFDDEEVHDSPVRIKLTTNNEAFDAISWSASNADDNLRFLETRITLAGEYIPDREIKGLIGNYADLRDLDVSGYREIAVCNFSISETHRLSLSRGRVLPVEPTVHGAFGANISILITDIHYRVDTDGRDIYSLFCNGRVIYKDGEPYDDADATIEFEEYEPNRFTGELPERAFAGEFNYSAKRSEEGDSPAHFWFRLRYVREDARKVLLPLLAQEAGTELILLVNVVNQKEDLLRTIEKLDGSVRGYNFGVRKRLLNDVRSRV